MTTLGSRLKEAREQSHLTQKEVASKLGISIGTLSGYERGYRKPDPEMLKRIANMYDVSADYILGRSDNSALDKNGLPKLIAKDKRDIARDLENIIKNLNGKDALAFNGEPMDDETRKLVAEAIESNLKMAKQLAKKKFTPKKYRKWE